MSLLINKNLSKVFSNLSLIYQYLGGENKFRALAYSKASKVINSLVNDISSYYKNKTLEDLPGIGKGIARKIEEYIKTGKILKYEELRKFVPLELMEMMEITGFGPKSLRQIHEELNISTKKQLIEALQNGAIMGLKRFGNKKIENMLRGLKLHKTLEERMLLWDALELSETLIDRLKKIPGIIQAEAAGSLRRRKETIGDIDILISCEYAYRKKIVQQIAGSGFVKQILAKGNTRLSFIVKDSGRQVDLRIVNGDEWGSALQYFTGSKEHNIILRSIAKEKGFKISEYGIFDIKSGKKIGGSTENEIYQTLGFQFIPPEMRENNGETELSQKHNIPRLVTLSDIKGDLQLHSNWSDGINTIEEIVQYVKNKFDYEYIVITDHSRSARVAGGMDEKSILEQVKVVESLNNKLGSRFLKTGLEVDILPDGSLDISDDVLRRLDWVTASVHSGFNKDNTQRIIRACSNPFVCCIGHPTGRLIGSREPYKLDIDKILEVSKKTNTVLEINAQPARMDLNDELVSRARIKGVKFVICTDSHSLANYDYMKLGIFIARRAWCTSEDILNTLSWDKIIDFVKIKRQGISNS